MSAHPKISDVSLTQSGATIIKPILDGRVDELRTLLESIGDDVEKYPDIPFGQLSTVHFMTWFIVENMSIGPCLFLELNVDGPIRTFLEDLEAKARAGLDQIYRHCKGYGDATMNAPVRIVDYLMQTDVGYDCFYIGWRGLSVARIRRERDLRAKMQDFLDDQNSAVLGATSPRDVREMLQAFVKSDPTLSWANTFPPRPLLVRYSKQVVAALIAIGGLIVLAIASVLWKWHGPWAVVVAVGALAAIAAVIVAFLRWHERTDSEAVVELNHTHVEKVVHRENMIVQNHLASVADVKSGLFRMVVLKTVLKVIHLLAAIVSNQGSLSGITSIHFARWVVVDGGKKLLFLTNYDGSWENYLDDFIDRASDGLTAIWSNTVGFPRTSYLTKGGARDELLFKQMTRRSQVPSLVWYSAYSDLSVQNIESNAAIREGLFSSMNDEQVKTWLKNF